VSKNFELMRRAGNGFERKQPAYLDVHAEQLPSPSVLGSAVESHALDWRRALDILAKHWRLSAIFAIAVFLTVVGVTYFTRPVYEATARMEIDPSGETFSLDGSAGSTDSEYLETQAQVLQSGGVAVDVIRKLHLDQNPELVGEGNPDDNSTASAPDSSVSGMDLTVREKRALHRFSGLLTVRRDTASRLVLVGFSSHDPQLAALIANTVVQTFIDDTFQNRHNAIMKSSEWLSKQLDDIRSKMETSSRALAEFQGAIGVSDVEGGSTYTEHMAELSRQFTQAEAERIQLQALLKNDQGNLDSLPEVRTSPVVQQLSQKLSEQRAELSQAQVVYGVNHPVVKKLQSQVDELQNQLNGQKHAIVNSMRASYAAAEAREQLMAAEMKGTTKEIGQMAQYTALKKEVQTEVDLYNSLYAKIKEAGIAAASKSANIRIVDPALVPDTPSKPRWALNLALGLLGAAFGGIMLAFVAEELDNKLRSPEDIKEWIGNSNVSIIPVIGEAERQEARLTWSKRIVGFLPTAATTTEDTLTNSFFLERPNSPEGEAVQALYGSIMLSRHGHPPQALLITSGFPGEGKTTVALNLSYALAKQGRTCLVDADLRKGRLARAFGLTSNQGLSEVLREDMSLDNALLEVPGMSSLSILPAGTLKGNAGQLICSQTMQQIVQELRERFQFVVIDSAPILPFVDGRALSTLADAVILVGRSGITTRQAMRRSVELLSEIHGAPILQVVLNAAQSNSIDYKHYGYGYTYEDTAPR